MFAVAPYDTGSLPIDASLINTGVDSRKLVATATIATLRPIAIAAPPAMLVAGASPRQSATGQQFCQYTYPTGERHCYASE